MSASITSTARISYSDEGSSSFSSNLTQKPQKRKADDLSKMALPIHKREITALQIGIEKDIKGIIQTLKKEKIVLGDSQQKLETEVNLLKEDLISILKDEKYLKTRVSKFSQKFCEFDQLLSTFSDYNDSFGSSKKCLSNVQHLLDFLIENSHASPLNRGKFPSTQESVETEHFKSPFNFLENFILSNTKKQAVIEEILMDISITSTSNKILKEKIRILKFFLKPTLSAMDWYLHEIKHTIPGDISAIDSQLNAIVIQETREKKANKSRQKHIGTIMKAFSEIKDLYSSFFGDQWEQQK